MPSAHCPRCGGEMTMHLRIARYFVENADWHAAQQRYADFIAQTAAQTLALRDDVADIFNICLAASV